MKMNVVTVVKCVFLPLAALILELHQVGCQNPLLLQPSLLLSSISSSVSLSTCVSLPLRISPLVTHPRRRTAATATATATAAFVSMAIEPSGFRLQSSSQLYRHGYGHVNGHVYRNERLHHNHYQNRPSLPSSLSSTSLAGATRTPVPPQNNNPDPTTFTTSTTPPPPLNHTPPRKVCLMVEPSPFTYVCGYTNRFNEMLRYMSQAGDEFEIITVEANTQVVTSAPAPASASASASASALSKKQQRWWQRRRRKYSSRQNKRRTIINEFEKGDKSDTSTTTTALVLTSSSPKDILELPSEKYGYKIHHTSGFTLPMYKEMSVTLDLPDFKGAHVIDKMKPDLIHVSSPGFIVFAAIFYARVMRIPLLMSYHTHLPAYAKNYTPLLPQKCVWLLLRWIHSKADLTLCTSPQLQAELTANGLPRVEVWRKGIDTVRFDPKFKSDESRNKMTNGNPDDFLMVYVGRLGDEKRLKDIRPMLEKMGDGVRLCIVGGGPQAEELHEYFKGTNTVFTGQMGGDDLSAAFASADAFVMPSDSETLGFVVLESMASGVPVVGAKAGGIPNLIHHGEDGYLVPPGDTDGFVEKLNLLKDDVELRKKLSKAARAEAERWSWEAATSVLRNVQYEKAIVNFHSRAFNGFGRPGSHYMWRLLKWRIKRIMYKLGLSSKPVPPTKSS